MDTAITTGPRCARTRSLRHAPEKAGDTKDSVQPKVTEPSKLITDLDETPASAGITASDMSP